MVAQIAEQVAAAAVGIAAAHLDEVARAQRDDAAVRRGARSCGTWRGRTRHADALLAVQLGLRRQPVNLHALPDVGAAVAHRRRSFERAARTSRSRRRGAARSDGRAATHVPGFRPDSRASPGKQRTVTISSPRTAAPRRRSRCRHTCARARAHAATARPLGLARARARVAASARVHDISIHASDGRARQRRRPRRARARIRARARELRRARRARARDGERRARARAAHAPQGAAGAARGGGRARARVGSAAPVAPGAPAPAPAPAPALARDPAELAAGPTAAAAARHRRRGLVRVLRGDFAAHPHATPFVTAEEAERQEAAARREARAARDEARRLADAARSAAERARRLDERGRELATATRARARPRPTRGAAARARAPRRSARASRRSRAAAPAPRDADVADASPPLRRRAVRRARRRPRQPQPHAARSHRSTSSSSCARAAATRRPRAARARDARPPRLHPRRTGARARARARDVRRARVRGERGAGRQRRALGRGGGVAARPRGRERRGAVRARARAGVRRVEPEEMREARRALAWLDERAQGARVGPLTSPALGSAAAVAPATAAAPRPQPPRRTAAAAAAAATTAAATGSEEGAELARAPDDSDDTRARRVAAARQIAETAAAAIARARDERARQRSKSPLRAWQSPLVLEVRGETRRDDMETLRGAVVRLESMLTSHEAVATHADAPPPAAAAREPRLDVPPELRLVHEALQSHRAARLAEPPRSAPSAAWTITAGRPPDTAPGGTHGAALPRCCQRPPSTRSADHDTCNISDISSTCALLPRLQLHPSLYLRTADQSRTSAPAAPSPNARRRRCACRVKSRSSLPPPGWWTCSSTH